LYYLGFLENGKIFDDSFDSNYILEFDVGNNYLLSSFVGAIQKFTTKDVGLIKIEPKCAYGNKQTGNIPPNSTLYYLVQITDIK